MGRPCGLERLERLARTVGGNDLERVVIRDFVGGGRGSRTREAGCSAHIATRPPARLPQITADSTATGSGAPAAIGPSVCRAPRLVYALTSLIDFASGRDHPVRQATPDCGVRHVRARAWCRRPARGRCV